MAGIATRDESVRRPSRALRIERTEDKMVARMGFAGTSGVQRPQLRDRPSEDQRARPAESISCRT